MHKMKIAVSSYSYSALDTDDFSRMYLAKEMGFDGIEFAEIHPADGVDKAEHARQLRALSEELSLPITNYAIYADFVNNDVDSEIERLKGEVDIAEILGVKTMRHDATGGPEGERYSLTGFEKYLPVLAKGCRAVTEYAAQKGIKTSVENHGYYCQQSDRVEALMKAVNHENFGWLVDMGNFMCADENPLDAVKTAAKYAVYVHTKDFYFEDKSKPQPEGYFDTRAGNHICGSVLGEGVVPVKECLKIIKTAGYDGWITLEYEGVESPLTGVRRGLEFLKNIL